MRISWGQQYVTGSHLDNNELTVLIFIWNNTLLYFLLIVPTRLYWYLFYVDTLWSYIWIHHWLGNHLSVTGILPVIARMVPSPISYKPPGYNIMTRRKGIKLATTWYNLPSIWNWHVEGISHFHQIIPFPWLHVHNGRLIRVSWYSSRHHDVRANQSKWKSSWSND